MRKVFTCAILVMLLFLMTASVGCADGHIDWKAVSQKAINVAIGEILIPQYEKYAGDKDNVIKAVKAILLSNAETAKYVDYVDLDAILGKIYDIVDAKWYEVLVKAGYDTDAEGYREPVTWYISILSFPEILEE